MRYRFYQASNNKVICTSTFAGKTVRGVAVCSANDSFNEDVGQELARARCDLKISEKRLKRSNERLAEAYKYLEEAQEYVAKMESYVDDSATSYHECRERLMNIEAMLK